MISKNNIKYRWMILSVIVSSQFVLSLASFGWGPLSPFLKKIMLLSSTQIGTISSTFYFASALSAFPAGIIVDRYGVKKGLLSWLCLTGFPLFFLEFAHQNYHIFLLVVAVAGLGYGMGNPVASKGLFIWFDKKLRGTVFGIRQSTVTLGGAVAGILLVYISQRSGPFAALRAVFWMIIGMILLTFFLYRTPQVDEHVPDGREPKDEGLMRLRLKDIFSNSALLVISLVFAMLGLAQGVIAAFFLLYINERLGYSLLAAGSLFTTVMISGAVGRVFWGVISDHFFNSRRKPVLIIISLLAFVSAITLAVWANTWPHWLFIPVVIGIGISSWGWNSISFVMVTEICDSTKTGTSVGLATTFGWLGISLGPMCFGIITDQLGYFYAWMSVAVFCVFSFLLCFLIPSLENRIQ
jgi:ACS family hexuronate transporter-like MFS transporter